MVNYTTLELIEYNIREEGINLVIMSKIFERNLFTNDELPKNEDIVKYLQGINTNSTSFVYVFVIDMPKNRCILAKCKDVFTEELGFRHVLSHLM